jgi:hypothetical protein
MCRLHTTTLLDFYIYVQYYTPPLYDNLDAEHTLVFYLNSLAPIKQSGVLNLAHALVFYLNSLAP